MGTRQTILSPRDSEAVKEAAAAATITITRLCIEAMMKLTGGSISIPLVLMLLARLAVLSRPVITPTNS